MEATTFSTQATELTEQGDGAQKHRFYNVDKFKELLRIQGLQPRPTIILRGFRRFACSLESVSGLYATFGGISVVFGSALVVLIAALYGGLVFWTVFLGMFMALTFYVDRKVGKSLEFGDYSVLRRGVATAAGFALVLGAIYALLLISGLLQLLQR